MVCFHGSIVKAVEDLFPDIQFRRKKYYESQSTQLLQRLIVSANIL